MPDLLYVTYRSTSRSSGGDPSLGVIRSVELGTAHGGVRRALTFAAGTDLAQATATLRASGEVVDVQPVHERTVSAQSGDPLLDDIDQWYLYRTNVVSGAWALSHGNAAVKVAVVDTGIDQTNPDLAPKIVKAETIAGGLVTAGAQDTNGHGTAVATLAAAATNNGYGFASVGYDTPLLVYKVFPDATATCDEQRANTADEAAAINDAVASGASVINLSLGGAPSAGPDAAERDAVAAAVAAGVTVVAAGGNEYSTSDGNQPDYPAAYPNVIAVGASAVTNSAPNTYASITGENAASYSNSGVTLLAPGGDATVSSDPDELHWIQSYSTSTAAFAADRCTPSLGVCRALFAGTSLATPQVTGTVALMMAYHGGPRSLTPAQTSAYLTQNAFPLPGVPANRQGAGRLDARKAVAAAHP